MGSFCYLLFVVVVRDIWLRSLDLGRVSCLVFRLLNLSLLLVSHWLLAHRRVLLHLLLLLDEVDGVVLFLLSLALFAGSYWLELLLGSSHHHLGWISQVVRWFFGEGWIHQGTLAHASHSRSAGLGPLLSSALSWHLLNLPPVFQVVHIVSVEILLVDNSLLIE